jgi:hypothetical protein
MGSSLRSPPFSLATTAPITRPKSAPKGTVKLWK